MSMPFGQLTSCHQYLCNGMYCRHLLWRASGAKFIHVLAARLTTTVLFCPRSLLAGTHITLGGSHVIRPQYIHAMSNTHTMPFGSE